jgi:fatty-acyl-CoA synthase
MIRFPLPSANFEDETKIFAGTALSDWVGVSSTYDMFRNSAMSHGSKTALTHIETGKEKEEPISLTYTQLFAEITRTANLLSHLGASPGNSVAVLLPNLVETHLFLWGAGAVSSALPLNHMLSAKVIAELMRAAQADILVTLGPTMEGETWQKAMAVRAELGDDLRCVIQVGGSPVDDSQVVNYTLVKARMPDDHLHIRAEPSLDDIAAFFHTGGTTGSPKLVQHTHRNHLASAFVFAYRYNLSCDDVYMNGLPLYHVAGVLPCSLSPFMAGAHVLNLSPAGLRNPKIQENIWRLVERYKVTSVGGVPTAIGALCAIPIEDADISSIRKALSGGALLPSSIARRFEELIGVPTQEVYGMTETSAVISSDLANCTPVAGSAGFPVPFVSVQIRPIQSDGSLNCDAVIGQPGALVVKGATVTPGYRDERQNLEAFTSDGWLITGDVAIQDKCGRITVTGRSKDVIIRSGHNIDPLLIEEAAMSYSGVAAAAAVAQPDAYAGELPVCYVVAKPGTCLDLDALHNHFVETVPERPAVPKHLYVIDALPLTSVGKVYKPELRCNAASRLLRDLLSDIQLQDISVTEDGSRSLHVTVSCSIHDDIEGIRKKLVERLQPFLFRWELKVTGEASK